MSKESDEFYELGARDGVYELSWRSRPDRRLHRGTYVLHAGMVIARSEDGRTRPTQIGGSVGAEETLARLMLLELAEQVEWEA